MGHILPPEILPVPARRKLQLRLEFGTGFWKIEVVRDHVEVRSSGVLADASDGSLAKYG